MLWYKQLITMHSKWLIFGTILLLICVFSVGSVSAESNDHTISAQGTGKVTTSPDQAVITLSVKTENTDLKQAQTRNAQIMTDVINALKSVGIPDDEIETSGYSVYSTREDSGWGSKTVFTVQNRITITTKQVDKAGELIDIAINNGANDVDSVYFTLSDEKNLELRSKALKAAVAQAETDAGVVAASIGKEIVDVQTVNIGSTYVPMTYSDSMTKSYAMEASGAAPTPTPVDPGTVDVTASVSIVYIII